MGNQKGALAVLMACMGNTPGSCLTGGEVRSAIQNSSYMPTLRLKKWLTIVDHFKKRLTIADHHDT